MPLLELANVAELAEACQLQESELHVFLTHKDNLYQDLVLHDSKTGKRRRIASPSDDLKQIQRVILRNIDLVSRYHPVNNVAQAYLPKRSILTAADYHAGAKSGFKLDIKDYFTSISAEKVAHYWYPSSVSRPSLEQAELARTMIQLGTRKNAGEVSIPHGQTYLPQGSPTSGLFANIASRGLDTSLWKIGRYFKLNVTRYSDDILFTSPVRLDRKMLERALASVSNAVRQHGFELNPAKTRLLLPGSRFESLGLMVDAEKPRLSRAKRRRIESDIRGIEKFGLDSHARERGMHPEILLRKLGGYLAFSHHIELEWSIAQKLRLRRAAGRLPD